MIKKFIFYLIVINATLNAGIYDNILANFDKFNLLSKTTEYIKEMPLPISIGAISLLCGAAWRYQKEKNDFCAKNQKRIHLIQTQEDIVSTKTQLIDNASKDQDVLDKLTSNAQSITSSLLPNSRYAMRIKMYSSKSLTINLSPITAKRN